MKSTTSSRIPTGLNLRTSFLNSGSADKISPLAGEILAHLDETLRSYIAYNPAARAAVNLPKAHIDIAANENKISGTIAADPKSKSASQKLEATSKGGKMNIDFETDFLAKAIASGIGEADALRNTNAEDVAASLVKLLETEDMVDALKSFGPKTAAKSSLVEIIHRLGDTALYFKVKDKAAAASLNYNQKAILGHDGILQFLFLKARYVNRCKDEISILDSISDPDHTQRGIRIVTQYVAAEAVQSIRRSEKIDFNITNKQGVVISSPAQTETAILLELGKNFPSLSDSQFHATTRKIVYNQVENQQAIRLLQKARDKDVIVADDDREAMVQLLKSTDDQLVNEDNAYLYVSQLYSSYKNSNTNFSASSTGEISGSDFNVTFYEDAQETAVFIKENVLCAGQLFYVMTLGEEMNIFGVISQITSKYLPSGMIDIRSRDVLTNLQQYVFNDSFRDLGNGTVYNRTRTDERRMFYKQIFNYGESETVEGMVVNDDFSNVWDNLMLECAKYRRKVERSINPEFFVSRQNVIQAAEDLRYNLSTHCTGMAKVVTPVISKELDFVIEKFLKNDDVIRQLALNRSGSFWKVIERVLQDMNQSTPNIPSLYKKAESAYRIISVIATRSNAELEDNEIFSGLMNDVEAYIIANSQLENRREVETEPADTGYEEEAYKMNGSPELVGEDWNF